jgi:hypothetical protein
MMDTLGGYAVRPIANCYGGGIHKSKGLTEGICLDTLTNIYYLVELGSPFSRGWKSWDK